MKYLADEKIKGQLIRGLLLHQPELDLMLVQDVGLLGVEDPDVLAWAADQGRILIIYDVRTMPDFAYKRIAQGLPMPGVIAIRSIITVGQAIEDLLTIAGASTPDELEDRVLHIPL